MKKHALTLLSLLFSIITFSQTAIPDSIFEIYLETHNIWGADVLMGDANSLGDGVMNNSVPTAKLNSAILVKPINLGISDMTGVEQLTSVKYLTVNGNSFASIDLSSLGDLEQLRINDNPNLVEIDASNNTALTLLHPYNCASLTKLNIANGENTTMVYFNSGYTPNLFCIQVDDVSYSGLSSWTIDSTSNGFSLNCSETIWDGTPAAWSNGAPNLTIDAIIKAYYDSDSDGGIEAKSLTVDSGSTLDVAEDKLIKIANDIVNNGSIIVAKGGSVIQISDIATVTGTASNFDVEVITTEMTDPRYTFFSSPTQGSTMNIFNSWAQMNRNFKFDGTTQDWDYTSATEVMIPGVGYIVRPTGNAITVFSPAENFTTNFDGAFNNGVITAPLYLDVAGATDPADDSSSLVGNPYPSAINSATLMTDNTSVNALYFWAHTQGGNWSTEEYKEWNSGGSTNGAPALIATGQGFFAVANASGTLTFNNAMRVKTDNNFLRPAISDLDKVWLNLMSNTNVRSQILIGFNGICSDGFDPQYDAVKFASTNAVTLASNGIGDDTTNLAIQTRGLLNNVDTIVPLIVSINDATITNLTLSIDHLENLENYDIFLKDYFTGVTHNLKLGDYTFEASQVGPITERFDVVFSKNALSTDNTVIESDDLLLINNEDNFTVKMRNGKIITNIQAFDILGKQVVDMNPNSNNFDVNTNLNQGTVLIIKATLENGQVVTKKFIKL
ncbi:MAG: hypothetical protein V3U80_09645 [Flavobacteriaceae bacterium]